MVRPIRERQNGRVDREGLDILDDQRAVARTRSGWRWAVVAFAMLVGWLAVIAAVGLLIWGLGSLLVLVLLNNNPNPL